MSMIRRPKDLVTGIVLLLVGLGVATVSARDYTIGSLRNMGPGFFPLVLGALLVMFGLAIALTSLAGARDAEGGRFALRGLVFVLGGAVAFGLLLQPLGVILAIMAAVLISAWASPELRFWPSLALALVLGFGSAAAFVWGLGQGMPLLGYWITG